ncbi:MAG: efflux transporter outer membrane subunit [Proteobacteria bacterium]|nr:efflux transporter outer membrane subunit [Pseudomonadota bacterium]
MPRVFPCLAIFTTLLAQGCAVGPNFKPPAAPKVTGYSANPLASTVSTTGVPGGETQRFVSGADISSDWWTLFHSAPLNELIEHSLANNPDLAAAQAALLSAREGVLAQRGVYYPAVSGEFSATRQGQSGVIAPTLASNALAYNLFTPQVTVSYVPDVFGLNRRTVESAQAQAEAVRFQMIATYNTLTSNVVVTAIQQGSVRLQMEATQQLIDIDANILQILRYQFEKGYANGVDVAAQESQLAQVKATLPPLEKQAAQLHNLMATLAGDFPSQTAAGSFELTSLKLPQDLPVSVPADLVTQRPDVRQAEAALHDASAKIGIARANRLPNITLTANTGSSASAINELFTSGTGFWAVGADLTAPIFQGGALLHQERAAKAAYAQAASQYRSTVLTACQNVADTLAALSTDADELKAAATAADAAKTALDLAERQWKDGYAGYVVLLSAQQAYQQARITLVQAQASRYADTAALFQALGGGWWHRQDFSAGNHGK